MFVDANWQRARAHFERSAEASWRAGDVRVWGGAVTAPWSSTGHPSLAVLAGVEALRTWLDGRSPRRRSGG